MLYGHSVSALLAPEYRAGTWFDVWQFQRGLTSSLFLLLSGFAFSVATTRRWSSHMRLSPAVLKRTRRFLTFALLGYALHFPVSRFVELAHTTDERWQTFLAVDVLQLIGVTFLGVQLLVMIARVRWVFTTLALALAAVTVAATPWVWSVDWTLALPSWAAPYLSPATGSQFPLFPWASYVLLGAALGQVYGQPGAATLARYANLSLLLPGAALVVAGEAIRPLADSLFGGGPSTFVPPEVLLRAGTCLLILGAMAHGSRFITRLPHVFGAVAHLLRPPLQSTSVLSSTSTAKRSRPCSPGRGRRADSGHDGARVAVELAQAHGSTGGPPLHRLRVGLERGARPPDGRDRRGRR